MISESHRVSASTFRTGSWVYLILGIVLLLAGGVGTAVVLSDRFAALLQVPGFVLSVWYVWPLLLPFSPYLLQRSRRFFRRAASRRRIAESGIPAWAWIQSRKQANWQKGPTADGAVFLLTLSVRYPDGSLGQAQAEDVLPWGLKDARYESWLPVLVDPQDRGQAEIQWYPRKR